MKLIFLTLPLIQEILRSAIDIVDLDGLLPPLSVIDQEKHKPPSLSLDCNQPKFHWVFRNIDYKKWDSASGCQMLWISGPPECNISQISSYVVDQEKNRAEKSRTLKREHLVLFFFYSSEITKGSVAVYTILNQIVHCSPMEKRIPIIQRFLHSLLEQAFKKEEGCSWKQRGFKEEDSPHENIKRLLNASVDELWAALRAVLSCEQDRELSIIVDGLEHIEHQRDKFIGGVRSFIEHLRQRTPKIKILLTSRPLVEIKELFNGLPSIEHDRERKGPSVPHVL